jgi:ABC-2 type transport system ATP-binding protein
VTDSALAVANLTKVYEGRSVLEDLSFDVPVGSLTVVIGPNGAGKTTLLEIIGGHRRPSAGAVVLAGRDRAGPATGRVGAVLQAAGFDNRLTVVEELVRFQAFYDRPRPIEDVCELSGLAHLANRQISVLSVGQRRQLDIALALIGDPSILLLDEPTASLDNLERDRVHHVLSDLRASGHTILLTTHDMAETEALATHVLVLTEGRLVARGRRSDVLSRIPAEVSCQLSSSIGVDALRAACHQLAISSDGGLQALVQDEVSFVAALTRWASQSGVTVESLRIGPPSLETVLRYV